MPYVLNGNAEKIVMISFRISEEQDKRLKEIVRLVKKEQPYMKVADIYRELLGVEDTGVITSEHRKLLKGDGTPRQGSKIAIYKANEDTQSTTKRRGRS